MKYVKQLLQKRLDYIIKNKPELANDQSTDNSKISALLMIKQSVKTIKMLALIMTLSYFIGLLWLMICDLEFKYADDEEREYSDYFLEYYP
jgi:hypothetical protein